MTIADLINDLPSIGAAAVAAYHVIDKAGGLRGVWRTILGPKEPPAK